MKNCATRPDTILVQTDIEKLTFNISLSTMDYLRKMMTRLFETQANLQGEISNLPEEHTHQLSGSRYASLKPHSSRCSPVVWHDIETLRISHRAYNSICVVESSEPIPGEHQRRCLRGTQGHKEDLSLRTALLTPFIRRRTLPDIQQHQDIPAFPKGKK